MRTPYPPKARKAKLPGASRRASPNYVLGNRPRGTGCRRVGVALRGTGEIKVDPWLALGQVRDRAEDLYGRRLVVGTHTYLHIVVYIPAGAESSGPWAVSWAQAVNVNSR